jgi:peptidyl-prolyl cis-trans isomerase SurA
MLVKEYREGILLFDLMNKEVWNKALIDTIGLKNYYHHHIDKYRWEERLDAIIFSSSNMQEIEMVRNLLRQTYYPISENILSLNLSNEEDLDSIMYTKLDSIFHVIEKDSTQFIEISCSEVMKDIFLEYFSLKNMNINKIIFKEEEEDVMNVKIISNSKKSLEKEFNKNSALTLQVESGFYERGTNEILDLIEWEPGIYDLSIENVEYLVYIERIVSSTNKNLGEVKGQVISDYQNFLEKEWIKDLKEKYSVNVNKNALSEIYTHFKVN